MRRDPVAVAKLMPARVMRLAPTEPQPITGTRTIRFVYSDESVDRDGDTVRAAGWQLGAYQRNPTALFGHDPSRPEHIIGRSRNLRVDGKQLLGEIEFMDAALNPTADMLFRMYREGFLKAVSVGFRPLRWEIAADRDDGKSPFPPIDYLSQELLEISCVAIPTNPNALQQAGVAVAAQRSAPLSDKERQRRQLLALAYLS